MLELRTAEEIEFILNSAEEAGIRIEFVGALPLWEAMPSARHQDAVRNIDRSITSEIAMYTVVNAYVSFPDGSLKRPDISIFGERPKERDTAIKTVPLAVVEVLSPGFETKDLQIGPSFYLSQGVEDIVVFDPRTNTAHHFTRAGTTRQSAPARLELGMGCQLDLPMMD